MLQILDASNLMLCLTGCFTVYISFNSIYIPYLMAWRIAVGIWRYFSKHFCVENEAVHYFCTLVFIYLVYDSSIIFWIGVSEILCSVWYICVNKQLLSTVPLSVILPFTYNSNKDRIAMSLWWLYTISTIVSLVVTCVNEFRGEMRMILFYSYGWILGVKFKLINDMDVFAAILKASSNKGFGLERYIACPAWLPIRSIESIDGDEWRAAHSNMKKLLEVLPDPKTLEAQAEILIKQLVQNHSKLSPIVADDIVRYSLECMIFYVFNRSWDDRYNIFIAASWEWRKELSFKGTADMSVKLKAVEVCLELIRESTLWDLFGEDWEKPEYYSLIMQPFIISPAINVSDIAVAFATRTPSKPESIPAVLRRMHPFPILERFIEHDLIAVDSTGKKVLIPAGTHAIAFMDLHSQYNLSPFGAGPRQCMGIKHAFAVLTPLDEAMSTSPAVFSAHTGHLYSGRHNDHTTTLEMDLYFITKLGELLRQVLRDRNNLRMC